MSNRANRRRDARRAGGARRIQQQKQRRPSRGGLPISLPMLIGGIVAIGALVAIIVVISILAGDDDAGGGEGEIEIPAASIPRDGEALGNPDAPVTLETYIDFQCPNCERFAREVEGTLVEEFVATGQVRIVARNFAFLGQESIDAANAALCAADQNLYWEYYKKLFDNRRGENVGSFDLGSLKSFARDIEGMDGQQFDTCLDSRQFGDVVTADRAEGSAAGITGTPGFVVTGPTLSQPVSFSGSPSIDEWRGLINEVLTGTAPTAPEGGTVSEATQEPAGTPVAEITAEPTQ